MSDTRATQSSEAPPASSGEPSERTHPSGPLDGTQSHLAIAAPNRGAGKAPPPKVIAHYELGEKLGEGGMGAVYKGWHPKMQRFGAVKLLPAELMQNPSLVTRFAHEIALIAKLDHPHVVRTHDAGEEAGLHYLVLEYLEGTDLSKLVKQKGPLSLENALAAIRQAALGLQHAHERGLVHRDIKPANLMLHRSGKAQAIVKVMDFGLALLTDGNSLTELTKSGQIMGTPEYMAPEQWESTHEVDARADLYSLGATLHFLLIGRSPYRRSETTTVMHLMKSHALDPIPDLTALKPDIPPEVNALFQRLLAKSRDDRPASALEVVREIDAILRGARGSRASSSGEPEAVRPRTTPEPNHVRGLTPPGSPTAQRQGDVEPSQTLSDLFDAIAADQRTVTLAPTNAARSRNREISDERATNSGSLTTSATKKRLLIAAALTAFVVLAGIIIKIKHKDGSVTEIKVPDGSQVEITSDKSKMAAPGRPAVPNNAANAKNTRSAKNSDDKTAEGGHPTRPTDQDREVAEWVLSVGGTLKVVKDGVTLSLAPGGTLPESPFVIDDVAIHSLRYTAKDKVIDIDNELARFAGLNGLRELLLDDNPVTDRGVAQLRDLPNLRHLYLQATEVTDSCLDSILTLQSLEILYLSRSKITPASLPKLKSLSKLRGLVINDWPFTATAAQSMLEIPSLRELALHESWLTDAGIAVLRHMQLTSLYIEVDGRLSDERLQLLAALP